MMIEPRMIDIEWSIYVMINIEWLMYVNRLQLKYMYPKFETKMWKMTIL